LFENQYADDTSTSSSTSKITGLGRSETQPGPKIEPGNPVPLTIGILNDANLTYLWVSSFFNVGMKRASPNDDEIDAQILGELAHGGVTEEYGEEWKTNLAKTSLLVALKGNFSGAVYLSSLTSQIFRIKKEGIKQTKNPPGRPAFFTGEHVQEMRTEIRDDDLSLDSNSSHELFKIIENKLHKISVNPLAVKTIGKTALKKYKGSFFIWSTEYQYETWFILTDIDLIAPKTINSPTTKNEKRAEAVNDFYSIISHAVACCFIQEIIPKLCEQIDELSDMTIEQLIQIGNSDFAGNIPARLYFNFDATSSFLTNEKAETVHMAVESFKILGELNLSPAQKRKLIQRRSIKFIFLTSADGSLHATIVIIKDYLFGKVEFMKMEKSQHGQRWIVTSPYSTQKLPFI
jgi:hypothetical protein